MRTHAILYPMLAMVLLTAVVGALMYRRRVGEMRARRIHPQKVATSAQMAAMLENTCAADNFRNLFETPVLFYAAVLTSFVTGIATGAHVALAWAYVGTRVVHSSIHCTYNRVMHRLTAFLASMGVLFALWGLIGWDLLVRNP